MTKREKRQEEIEINFAVQNLCAAVRQIARRKARTFELEILTRVRDELSEEIKNIPEVDEALAKFTARQIENEALKP